MRNPTPKLTEEEKFQISQWMMIPGNYPPKRPERVDPDLWKDLTAIQRLKLAYHEWVHQMMMEGKL